MSLFILFCYRNLNILTLIKYEKNKSLNNYPSLLESVLKNLYIPPRHKDTKNNVLKIKYFVSLCLSGLNNIYVLRYSPLGEGAGE